MRFKATISDTGMTALERCYLPTLEKFGKRCNLVLTPDDIYLIQDANDADGMQICARLSSEFLYEPRADGARAPHACQSRLSSEELRNFIGFSVEIALLLKVLRSAAAYDAGQLDVKLAVRAVPGAAPSGGASGRPMLVFSWRGNNMSLGQEMPIGAPHGEPTLALLKQLCDVATLCPFYLDILPDAPQLMGVLDKLRGLVGPDGEVLLSLSRQGDLHLGVAGSGVKLGEGLRGLAVMPASAAEAAHPLTAATAEGRLREASALGDVASVTMQVKHLLRAVHSAPLTSPVRLLAGVAEGGAYVHVMFVFREPGAADYEYDANFDLTYKLPTMEDSDF